MDFVQTYLIVAVGIAISIVLPILRKALPTPDARTSGWGGFLNHILAQARPYLIVGAFSLVLALLLVAFLGDSINDDARAALLAGYAWDSTLQKLR
jgi:hypothetical protein